MKYIKAIIIVSIIFWMIIGCQQSSVVRERPIRPDGLVGRVGRDAPPHKPVVSNRVSHPDKLVFPPLEVKIPKAERQVLKNGLVVYLLEDRELPLINVSLLVKSGAIYEPADKGGLCTLMSTLLRTGGTKKYASEKIDEILELKAAGISASADYEEARVSLACLSRDIGEMMGLMQEVVFAPAFKDEKLQYERSRLLQRIQSQYDEPSYIAEKNFLKLLYGTHPFSEPAEGTKESLNKITRDDIVKFHKSYFVPNNMTIGVTGDFRKHEFMELLQATFGSIPAGNPPKFDIQSRANDIPQPVASANYVPKEINQTTIRLGHIGIERLNPDYFPVIVMNAILGGESVSRLYQSVREEEGLAYSVFSYWAMHFTGPGFFIAGAETDVNKTHKSVELIIREITKMRDGYVDDSELSGTKDAVINRFVFRFDNSDRIVEQYMYIEYIGLPKDYLETYCAKINAVTKEDIHRVAQKYLQPDKLLMVLVGDSQKFDPAIWKLQGEGITPKEIK